MPAYDQLDIAKQIGPQAALTVERLRRFLTVGTVPGSLARLYKAIGGAATTTRRHLALAKRAGIVTWTTDRTGCAVTAVRIIGVKQRDQRPKAGVDEQIGRRDARRDRDADDAPAHIGAELVRDGGRDIGINERRADRRERRAGVRLTQRIAPGDRSDGSSKTGLKAIKHAPESSDSDRFTRSGLERRPAWTAEQIDAIRVLHPNRYGSNTSRKAVADLLTACAAPGVSPIEAMKRAEALTLDTLSRPEARTTKPAVFFSRLAAAVRAGGAA